MLDVYRTFYKLSGEPFRLSPDHRFSLAHSSYANAMSYLQYAIFQGEGFIAVTGGPGTGKTTLIGDLIEGLDKNKIEVATLTTTQLESRELLQMVVNLFDLSPEDTSKPGLLLALEQFLNKQSHRGRRVILIVDEAQGLTKAALEELRLLANLQRNHQLLLQVFLVGQEPLLELLRAPGMEHLHQRLIAASHLQSLGLDEVIDYIEHRLSRVGWKGDPKIDEGALRLIYKYSGGIPRKINLICNRLFLYGGLEQKHEFVTQDAELVIEELHKEFLLSAGSTDENEPVEETQPESGADVPVRSLPRKDMNAAPAADSDEPPSPAPKKEPAETASSETRTQPKIAIPTLDKARQDKRAANDKKKAPDDSKKTPEQTAPDRVVGSKKRIEPTMRRDPYIGIASPASASKPGQPWKNRSLGKVAAGAIFAGFVYVAFFGAEDSDMEVIFSDTSEVKPHAAFSTPLDTNAAPDEPALDVGTLERAPDKMEESVTAPVVTTDNAPSAVSAADSEADARTSAPDAKSGQDGKTSSVSVLSTAPGPVTRERVKEAVIPAQPAEIRKPDDSAKVASAPPSKPVETAKREPVRTTEKKAAVEAEKARLRREAELRLAMNLNQGEGGQKKPVPVPVKTAPAPKKKSTPPPVTSKPKAPVKAPVKVATAPIPVPVKTAPVPKKKSTPPPITSKPKTPVKAPVKVATAPKIETVPKRSPLDQLKAALLEGQWTSRGKPASLLPSKVTYCNSQGARIACQSVPQDINTKYGAALYKVETTLQEFSAERRFQLSYRTLVKLLGDDSDSTRDAALASDTDWQISDYYMSCQLTQPDQVQCRDKKGVTRDYRRSTPAVIN